MNKHLIFTASILLASINCFAAPAETKMTDEDLCFARWEKVLDQIDAETASTLPVSVLFKCDNDLKKEVKALLMKNQEVATYSRATKFMYKYLDNINGELCSVYTPNECNIMGEPERKDDDIKPYTINCEHTWPKSLGARDYPMKSDLHHLYPTEKLVNAKRGNHPFCEVSTVIEDFGDSKLGLAKGSTEECFEPPMNHKGNVARSMLYFAVRYDHALNKDAEDLYRAWNKLDPVSKRDIKRNDKIEDYQGNRNLFVDHPELIDLIADF